jgi:hypothetical protein
VIPEVQPPLTEEELAELLHEKVLLPKGRYRHTSFDLSRLVWFLNRFVRGLIADQSTWDLQRRERRAFRDFIARLDNLEADCRRRAEEGSFVMRVGLLREADKFAARRDAILAIDGARIVGAWSGLRLRDWQDQRDWIAAELRKTLEAADPPINCSERLVDRFLAALLSMATGKERSSEGIRARRHQRPQPRTGG